MGVRGLTKYIDDRSKLYLKPHELRDCHLVVDGNSIAHQLYKWSSKSDSAFGGDYDEYYKTVRDFFMMLLKCNVTPVVVFDGGYEKKKLKTILKRSSQKLFTLKAFAKGFCEEKFFCLFMKLTFWEVMEDLGVLCVQSDLEADMEIAAVAKGLDCAVLSYDSDFYIYDVLYIPFSSCGASPVLGPDGKSHVQCSIYDVENFLKEFEGLDKSLLPFIATLLGNDYIENAIFQKFFHHVSIPKSRNSYSQRRIHAVLHWLKKESKESATQLILSHLEIKNREKVLQAINSTIKDYTEIFVSETVVDALTRKISNLNLKKRASIVSLPSKVIELYHSCKIDKFVVDMINLNQYISQLQIEEVFYESSHLPSLQLIRGIYSVLSPYLKDQSKPLKLYLTVRNCFCAVKVEKDLNCVGLGDILEKPREERLKFLYRLVGVEESDIKSTSNDGTWTVFIISLIYWLNKLIASVSFAHIQALILMAIANQVVQKRVGYFRTYAKFAKSKGSILSKLTQDSVVEEKQGKDLRELLENVTTQECLLAQGAFLPLRKTTEKGKGKAYSVSVIHLFNSFQSVLYHVMQLNALFDHPLPHLKICDFYSGTLLFNIYLGIKSKPNFIYGLLKNTPNLSNMYKYLCDNVSKCTECIPLEQSVRPKKRNRRNNKTKEVSQEELIVYFDEDGEDDYSDEGNLYSILQKSLVC